MLLEAKTALITGAARGIGKQIALAFAREGANIAFTDLEYNEQVQSTKDEISALGVKVHFYASDASDFGAAHSVVEQVIADFGRIDILVNNAGITRDTLLVRMTEEQWDRVIQVNLKSAFNFTHAVTPAMMKQRNGSIISLGGRNQRQCRASQLCGIESRHHCSDEVGGERTWRTRNTRQCDRSWIYTYGYDQSFE